MSGEIPGDEEFKPACGRSERSAAEQQQPVVSCDELKIVCDLVVQLTEKRQHECKHLSIENFSPDLFARLLYELAAHKAGMIRAEWFGVIDN